MENMIFDRLLFRRHEEPFVTREAAIEYIMDGLRDENGETIADKSRGYSLLGEPTIVLYHNEGEEDKDPHVILAIGARDNLGDQYTGNRFCFIDIDKTEAEIEMLGDKLDKAIKALLLWVKKGEMENSSLELNVEHGEDGQFITGDVRVPDTQIIKGTVRENKLWKTNDGLYIYINLSWDADNEELTFTVNDTDTVVNIPNNYLVSGHYDIKDESLHLLMKKGEDVVVPLKELIEEWTVEGSESKTPIVLTREHVDYKEGVHEAKHQDVLRADVRVFSAHTHNILEKTIDGKYLFVDGRSSNIAYFKDGEKTNVKEALDELFKIGLSSDNNNILYEKPDGYYASANLSYIPTQNTLVFTTSNVDGGVTEKKIELNAFKIFEDIYYDQTKEELVIMYLDQNGKMQKVLIPIGSLLRDWEWDITNDGHNVKLSKLRAVNGNDKVSADVKITDHKDNILEDFNHSLLVRGTADNIKYTRREGENEIESNVKKELDLIHQNVSDTNDRLDAEIARAEDAENILDDKIEAENARAEAAEEYLQEAIDAEAARAEAAEDALNKKLDDEIERSTTTDDALLGMIKDETARAKTEEHRIEMSLTKALHDETDRAEKSETQLQTNIDNEETRAKGEEQRIETKLETEIAKEKARAESEEQRIETKLETLINEEKARAEAAETLIEDKIDDEVDRATKKDAELQEAIDAETKKREDADAAHDKELREQHDALVEETSRAMIRENELDVKIDEETFRAKTEEARIEDKLDDEIARSVAKDEDLQDQIDDEVERAKDAEKELKEYIDAQTLTFEDTTSVKLRRTERENDPKHYITADVKLANSGSNILVIDKDRYDGVYASVELDYNEGTNVLTFIRSNTKTGKKESKDIKLNVANIITKIYYDATTRELVILYSATDGTKDEARVDVQDLFEDWDVLNPEVGSALRLVKTSTEGSEDTKISGYVLINDTHPHNIIKIESNGLVVEGTAENIYYEWDNGKNGDEHKEGENVDSALDYLFDHSDDLAERVEDLEDCCDRHEKNIVDIERVVGIPSDNNNTPQEPLYNGSGCVITSGMTMVEADKALEKVVCDLQSEVDDLVKVTGVEQDKDSRRLDKPYYENCVITGSHSLVEADNLLAQAICDTSGDTNIKIVNITKIIGSGVDPETGNAAMPNYNGCNLKGEYTLVSADTVLDEAICELKNDVIDGTGLDKDENGNPKYTPKIDGCVISGATNLMDADKKLDDAVCDAQEMIKTIIENVGLDSDGTYNDNPSACFIGSATTVDDATNILDTELCRLQREMDGFMNGSDTASAHLRVFFDKADEQDQTIVFKRLKADVRLSYGNDAAIGDTVGYDGLGKPCETPSGSQSDTCNCGVDDNGVPTTGTSGYSTCGYVFIFDKKGQQIDGFDEENNIPERRLNGYNNVDGEETYYNPQYEFTDTNALRIVEMLAHAEGESEKVTSRYNGLYLSNIWNCGEYTLDGENTPNELYQIDQDATAGGYDFSNNTRNSVATKNNGDFRNWKVANNLTDSDYDKTNTSANNVFHKDYKGAEGELHDSGANGGVKGDGVDDKTWEGEGAATFPGSGKGRVDTPVNK